MKSAIHITKINSIIQKYRKSIVLYILIPFVVTSEVNFGTYKSRLILSIEGSEVITFFASRRGRSGFNFGRAEVVPDLPIHRHCRRVLNQNLLHILLQPHKLLEVQLGRGYLIRINYMMMMIFEVQLGRGYLIRINYMMMIASRSPARRGLPDSD
jgi:hypothetical protein